MALREVEASGDGGRKKKAKLEHQEYYGMGNVEDIAQQALKQQKKQKRKERELLLQGKVEDVGQHGNHGGFTAPKAEVTEQDAQTLQHKKKKKKDRALVVEDGVSRQSAQQDVATPQLEVVSHEGQDLPQKKKKKKKDRGPSVAGQVEDVSGQRKHPEDAALMMETSEQVSQGKPEEKKKKKKKDRALSLAVDGSGQHSSRKDVPFPELVTGAQEQPQQKKKKKHRGLSLSGQVEDASGQHVSPGDAAAPSIEKTEWDVGSHLLKKKKKKHRTGQDEIGLVEQIISEDVATPGLERTEPDGESQLPKKKKRKDRLGQGEASLGEHKEQLDVVTPMVEAAVPDAERRKKKRKERALMAEGHTEAGLEKGDAAAQNGEETVPERKKKKRKTVLETEEAELGAVTTVAEPTTDKVQTKGETIEVVVPLGDRAETWKADEARTDLKFGPFSKEEDERLKAAVAEYIQENNLGEDGVEKLLNSRKYPELKGAWLEIGRCIPDRSVRRVHARATRLLHDGNYKGKWSPEEEAMLRSLYAQMGPKWAHIGRSIGRLAEACKEKWRILRVTEKRKGQWSPEESQKLARLVHESLAQKQTRTSVEREIDNRQVRDDIDWTPISDRMGDRTANQCLRHWYDVLAPRRVRSCGEVEEWGGEDDRIMLQRIVESGAMSEVDVEWGFLLPDRDGATCRKRWRMMVKHLPRGESFEDSVTTLCERYAPDLVLGGG